MSATRYDNEGAFARSTGRAAVRGALLIAAAVIIGLVLLSRGLDNEPSTNVSSGHTTTTAASSPTTAASGSHTTTTSATPRPPNEVKVIVANGSGVPKAASFMGDQLKTKSYNVLEPANAKQRVQATVVYYGPGYQREATQLARAIGANPSTVQAMPNPPPVDRDIAGANVVVILGPDLAKAG